MKRVTLYTAPHCVYCRMAKSFLMGNEVPYAERDVLADPAARTAMIALTGQSGVPVIEIDEEIFVGFNRAALAEALDLS